jgi:hypothetical protein
VQITRGEEEGVAKVLLGLMGVAVLIDVVSLCYLVSNSLLTKMWVVVWHNFQYPLVLALLGAYGVFWKWKDEDFTVPELGIYAIVIVVVTFPLAGMFYFTSTNLHDVEIWNGYAAQAVYKEKWTEEVTTYDEECTGSGKDRSCHTVTHTHNEYHPPKWYITTNNGEEVTVSRDAYRKYAGRFGNETFKRLLRLNQVSFGDGNMYFSDWKGQQETMVPTSVEHPFVNYLRASQSITKVQGMISSYKDLLLPYPHVHTGPLGDIYVDRVLVAGTQVPDGWKQGVSDGLSNALATLGAKKQVNVLVYVTSADNGFFYALKEYWTGGKKNDVIVVIGSKDGKNIDWVQVQAWTKVELFKVQLADSVRELNTLESNAGKLVDAITTQIAKAPDVGGFQRMPMADLEYLLTEISLPWWATLLMIVLSVLIATPIIVFLTTTNITWKDRTA